MEETCPEIESDKWGEEKDDEGGDLDYFLEMKVVVLLHGLVITFFC